MCEIYLQLLLAGISSSGSCYLVVILKKFITTKINNGNMPKTGQEKTRDKA
uniref:Uncharacterized protein n=1 Tax=Glossina palpalis gambiensis TaxID=67801 RepID=A0A1B0BEB9_9MUSC